jgi:hypothetical protein
MNHEDTKAQRESITDEVEIVARGSLDLGVWRQLSFDRFVSW